LTQIQRRVARFFLVHDTKTGKNVPNEHKLYQMAITYPKCLTNIPNGQYKHKHFPIKGPQKLTQIWIFGLKINHLATLIPTAKLQCLSNSREADYEFLSRAA
jgi:hypothetical protein